MTVQTSEIVTPHWEERFAGGSERAEKKMFEQFARDIRDIQARIVAKTGQPGNRTLHAKIIVGVRNAYLTVDKTLPSAFAAGYFQPEAKLPVSVRLSNASPLHSGDAAPDMRGAALRVDLGDGAFHDLLMTSYPVSHARDAWQFIEVAKIATGPKRLILPRFLFKFGLAETRRIIGNIKSGSKPVASLATLQFWSRAPLLWGGGGPVRYTIRPIAAPATAPDLADADYLETEFAQRLTTGDVTYRLALQRYVDEERTPIEDGAVEWLEQVSPFIEVATLTIPQQTLYGPGERAARDVVNGLAFNPWNCPEPFRPLGNLNRARGPVYASSAEGWLRR